jgi:hypothetical protein
MRAQIDEEFTRWVSGFSGLGILGFLCTLLLLGKVLHHGSQNRGGCFGILAIPPVFISGLLGIGMDILFYTYSRDLGFAMEFGMQQFRKNMLSFTFAAVMLGLCCRRKTVTITIAGTMDMMLHEGMPMLIYSQILSWGQTTVNTR